MIFYNRITVSLAWVQDGARIEWIGGPAPSRPVPSRPVPSRPVPSRPVPSRTFHTVPSDSDRRVVLCERGYKNTCLLRMLLEINLAYNR